MGVYSEYLDSKLSFGKLQEERKAQLKRIQSLRGDRDVMVIAADLNSRQASIGYDDLLPVQDQLANLSGSALDVILETPGGSGETVEDIVSVLRSRYEQLGMLVPGWAKSAGTIMVMAGDEILMGPGSALGPIDAQLSWQTPGGCERIAIRSQPPGVCQKPREEMAHSLQVQVLDGPLKYWK